AVRERAAFRGERRGPHRARARPHAFASEVSANRATVARTLWISVVARGSGGVAHGVELLIAVVERARKGPAGRCAARRVRPPGRARSSGGGVFARCGRRASATIRVGMRKRPERGRNLLTPRLLHGSIRPIEVCPRA